MEDTNREEQNEVYGQRRIEWSIRIEKNRMEYTARKEQTSIRIEKNRMEYTDIEELNGLYR